MREKQIDVNILSIETSNPKKFLILLHKEERQTGHFFMLTQLHYFVTFL